MSSPATGIGADEDLEAAARLMVSAGSAQIVLAESRTPECEAIVVSFP